MAVVDAVRVGDTLQAIYVRGGRSRSTVRARKPDRQTVRSQHPESYHKTAPRLAHKPLDTYCYHYGIVMAEVIYGQTGRGFSAETHKETLRGQS